MNHDIKRKIIDATIRLIEKKENKPEDITVREICAEAGVALSLINYHFQSKDNLIAQCIQLMIGDVIGTFPEILSSRAESNAIDTLKRMMFSTLNYLYSNENISRLSILTDHHNAHQSDNTAQTIQVYRPLVEAALKERGINEDPNKFTMMMVLAIQGVFLRTDVVKETLGIDLRDEEVRKQFIDDYIKNTFNI